MTVEFRRNLGSGVYDVVVEGVKMGQVWRDLQDDCWKRSPDSVEGFAYSTRAEAAQGLVELRRKGLEQEREASLSPEARFERGLERRMQLHRTLTEMMKRPIKEAKRRHDAFVESITKGNPIGYVIEWDGAIVTRAEQLAAWCTDLLGSESFTSGSLPGLRTELEGRIAHETWVFVQHGKWGSSSSNPIANELERTRCQGTVEFLNLMRQMVDVIRIWEAQFVDDPSRVVPTDAG